MTSRRLVKLVAGSTGLWLTIGIVWGAQTSLGSTVGGGERIPLARAIPDALRQTIPWIPVTIAAVLVTLRFPIERAHWIQRAVVHLIAAVLLAWVANALLVLGYWIMSGNYQAITVLAREGARWATVRLHVGLLIYGAILAVTQAALYYQRTQEREIHTARLEGQLARARLQALNAQIRPHFLFNTLHSIGQMWRANRPVEADAMLDHLGGLFHKVHHSTSQLEVPLADELAMVRDYLAIEQARFPDRMRATIDAPDEALTHAVPPLILQPIVENAVRHGISTTSTAGAIDVVVDVNRERLRITVRDDGPGPNGATGTAGTGTGLRNTRERLAELYGARAILRVEESHPTGTLVTIEIPSANRL